MVYRKYVSAFILGTRYLQRVFYCLNLYNRLYALPMEQATYSAVVPWMLSWIHWWVLSPTAFIKQSPVNGLDEDVSLSWLESPLCVCTRCYGWKYEFLVLSVHLYHVWDRIHQRHDPIQHTSGIFHQHLWTGLSDSVLLYRCCIRSNPYRFYDPALHELLGASEWRDWGWVRGKRFWRIQKALYGYLIYFKDPYFPPPSWNVPVRFRRRMAFYRSIYLKPFIAALTGVPYEHCFGNNNIGYKVHHTSH